MPSKDAMCALIWYDARPRTALQNNLECELELNAGFSIIVTRSSATRAAAHHSDHYRNSCVSQAQHRASGELRGGCTGFRHWSPGASCTVRAACRTPRVQARPGHAGRPAAAHHSVQVSHWPEASRGPPVGSNGKHAVPRTSLMALETLACLCRMHAMASAAAS